MWSVWLVFCNCVFHSVCSLMVKDKRLMKASWWRDWLRGKLGLVLMGGAMLSKSLIQFSVDGLGCVPSLLFDLRPNCGGGNEGNGDLIKRLVHCCTQCSWTLQQATADPHLCWRLLDTHGEVSQSLVGSLLLYPGSWCAQGFIFALQERVCSPIPV